MYFDNAKVGDEVWDYVYGKGKICKFTGSAICVKFPSEELIRYLDVYKYDGKNDKCINQRLYYYDERPIVIAKDDIGLSDRVENYRLVENCIYDSETAETYLLQDTEQYVRKVHRDEKPEEFATDVEDITIIISDDMAISDIDAINNLLNKCKLKLLVEMKDK